MDKKKDSGKTRQYTWQHQSRVTGQGNNGYTKRTYSELLKQGRIHDQYQLQSWAGAVGQGH